MIVASRFRRLVAVTSTLAALVVGARSQAAQAHSSESEKAALLTILKKAATNVEEFESQFSQVVGSEVYNQDVKDDRRLPRRRLDSEVYFARLSEETPALMVRNVLMVNGRRVEAASRSAIERAFADQGAGQQRLKALANQGARYNAGGISRNFGDPTLALLFLGRIYRSSFTFMLDGMDSVNGRPATRVRFEEIARPTIIKGPAGINLPASGHLFIDDSGHVVKSALTVGSDKYSSSVTVTFKEDPSIQMFVPNVMEERHLAIVNERQLIILCRAEYSRFRRFQTSGRIIAPDP